MCATARKDYGAAVSEDAIAWFRDTAFILGPFPTLSQTFIYRELDAMMELGLDVNVVSTGQRQPEAAQMTDALRAIQRSALYLQYGSPRVIASMAVQSSSRQVRQTMRWMMGFAHRTPAKRMRAAAAVLVAAHFAPTLRERGIRYVHSHFAGFQTEVAMSLSHLLGVPYGCTWHAYGIYRDRNILEQKLAGALVVLTCTQSNVEHLRRLCPSAFDRIHLAYHGLDLAGIPEAPPIAPDDVPVILAVGRIVAKKGFDHLVEAASMLQQAGRSFEIRFIGEGPGRPGLEALVRKLGLRQHVTFLGAQPNAEVFHQMAAARVIAVPSVVTSKGDMDGLPNVVLEAMSMARPVVGSRVSGIPEVVLPGETGLLAKPGNARDLAAQLGVLLEDPLVAQTLGRNAQERIRHEFDVRQNVRQVIRHITESLEAQTRMGR